MDQTSLVVGFLPEGYDPDDYVAKYPKEFEKFCSQQKPGSIVLLFDGDEAGRSASRAAIDKFVNLEIDDGQGRENKNWSIYMDEYDTFLRAVISALGTEIGRRQNFSALRNWTTPRLQYALITYHQIIESALFYGNSYCLEWVLPLAKEYRAKIEHELESRATPRKLIAEGIYSTSQKQWLDARQVRDKIDVFETFRQFIPDLKRGGVRIAQGTCPLHSVKGRRERTASFTVYIDDGGFKCFGCQAGGSIFDLVMRLENMDFAHAVNRVGELARIV